MNFLFKYLLLCACLVLVSSCDKGYKVRFTNYYLEPMDSVKFGDNRVVFKDVEVKTTTSFSKITKGTYQVTCITKSKKTFSTSIEIPKRGSGDRTVQIDGLASFSILEE